MLPSALFSIVLLLPLSAHAEVIEFWNLRGNVPGQPVVHGLDMAEVIDDGLHVRTEQEGYIVWGNHPVPHPTEVITIRVKAAKPGEGSFLWRPLDAGVDEAVQIPFFIPGDAIGRDIDIVLSRFSQWDWRTERFAIGFAPGTEVLIQEITFRHWTPMERLAEGWKSFWTFDDFKAYSINFLWGPLVAGNTPARETLFDTSPPSAWSALRIFYPLLAVAAAIALGIRLIRRDAALALGVFAGAFALLWIVFDIRMGSEIISYAIDDLHAYVWEEPDNRVLRSHGKLYALLEQTLPIIHDHEHVALFAQPGSVVFPNVRYRAYPATLSYNEAATGATLWLIVDRPDIEQDAEGRLVLADGTGTSILSPPGRIIRQFTPASYLFVPSAP